MLIAVLFGFIGFISAFVGFTMRAPRSIDDLVRDGIHTGLNTVAVTFWIAFPILYLIRVPKSAAALDWDRRLAVAEEVFKREKAQGRGSRWM
jgi:hypothetical protein